MTNCFSAHESVIWCLFPELRSKWGNKHQNNTRVSAKTVRHETTYIIIFLIRHNESINDDKNDDLYASSMCHTCSVFVLLMTSQSIADDVTMTWQLWRDHVNNDIYLVGHRFFTAIFTVGRARILHCYIYATENAYSLSNTQRRKYSCII